MNAAKIAHILGGRKSGASWLMCCVAHEDRTPSLSLTDGEDGRLLVHCFAGCDPHDVLAVLQQRGLLAGKNEIYPHPRQERDTKADMKRATARIEAAMRLWKASKPIVAGCPVETYLRGRGIILPQSPALRYHPALKHPAGGYWPAMMALVQRGEKRQPIGIHRTFLAKDGKGKALLKPDKMMLGLCHGGAVRLVMADRRLAIAEGLETSLSILQATGVPTWAALSAGGIERLILPPLPLASEITVCADNDASGTGQRAAENAAQRWRDEGRVVRIAIPPETNMDFNDILTGKCTGETPYVYL